jgi:ATP-dependent 26S proteasome regulatory subunit
VDAILQGRGTDTGRYTEEQTNQMLICIDGFKKLEGIATIFATNRIDLLDEALLDRFSSRYIIEFPLPDEKAREQIFKIKLAKMKVGESVNPASLAERTAEANGRDIDDILTQAGIHAIKEEKDAVYAEDIEYGLRQEGF